MSPETIEQRLLYAMLNEAAMAVGEGVVRSPRDGDIGAIFGIGFPPFRGGPLRVIDTLGGVGRAGQGQPEVLRRLISPSTSVASAERQTSVPFESEGGTPAGCSL